MTAAWPSADVPHQPLADGYRHLFADRRSRSEMEQGASRQRAIYASAKTVISMQWAFTPDEYEGFHAFLAWDISGGADAFIMPVFTGANGYENLTVNFVADSIQPKRVGGEWIVAADLEADELPAMSSTALDAIIGAAGAGLPVWPEANLPPWPLNEELGVKLPNGVVRSDFEDGYRPQMQEFHAAPSTYSVTLPMEDAQYDLFRAFRKWRLSGGGAWFSMPIFRGNQYVTLTARIAKGTLMAERSGPDWLISFDMELRDLPPLARDVALPNS